MEDNRAGLFWTVGSGLNYTVHSCERGATVAHERLGPVPESQPTTTSSSSAGSRIVIHYTINLSARPPIYIIIAAACCLLLTASTALRNS